jgi:DNA mismatch repair protein MutS2
LSNHLYQTLEFDKVIEDLARRTYCPVAAESLRHLKPLSSPELVRKSLARISEVRTFMDSGGSLPMNTFDDIGSHLESAAVEASYLDPKAFRQIHDVLELSARIHSFLKANRSSFPLLHEVGSGLSPNPDLAKEIARAIDLRSLEIRDQASPTLAAIRRDMARTRERVRRQLEGLLDTLSRKGVLQERLITIRSGRWVLPVKETHRYLVEGVLHDKSASGATVFVEPLETLEPNNQIRRLEAEERHEIEKVLRTLTDLVRKALPELEQNFEILITLDCIHAAALASKTLNQHEPALNTDGVLKIKKGRHPLLVLQQEAPSSVVPLDLSVGEDFDTLVITGPNAGGKTVALKAVGLLALMVSCGLHIPADADSQVPLYNRIFANIGDAQSIEMNLSTFSAHLKEIKAIVEEASSGDLVLIDEIGTGTDPQEGAALAMAVLEALTARGVMTLVTTHHGALKAFAHQTPGIANGSMAFDSHTLTPTYKFRPNLPGSSYALEIAKRMGLPEPVINRSKSLMGSQANQVEELLLKLNDQIEQNMLLEKDLKRQKKVAEGLRKRYEEENARLARQSRQLRHKAAEEAAAVLKRANVAVEKAIQTIREKGAAKEAIREARAIIQKEKEPVRKELEAAKLHEQAWQADQPVHELKPGDRVCWKRTGTTGIILSDPDPAGRFLAAFGNVKAHVPREELTPAKEDIRAATSHPLSGVHIPTPEKVQPETDIRGKRVEEALRAVDKFLDDAMLAGLREVRIIHGVGTGALRSNLLPFLDQHPLVQATRPGGPHEQNLGVTIVEIATK